MDLESLRRLGLTEGEIKVYMTLLEVGRAPITLLSHKTKLNRTSLYDVVDGLIEKGLVSFVFENKKKYFRAAKPDRLLEYLHEQQSRLKREEDELKATICVLEKIKPLKEEQLHVEIFRGKKGIKTILEDVFKVCKRGDEVLAFGFGGSNLFKVLGHYYHHYIMRGIHEHGLKYRAISDEREQSEAYVKSLKKLPKTNVKFVLQGFESPTHTRIFGDKVAIILIEKDPTAILIDDAKVAKGYRQFFEFLWSLT